MFAEGVVRLHRREKICGHKTRPLVQQLIERVLPIRAGLAPDDRTRGHGDGRAVAVDAQASEWLLLCTGMLALFLGFTKRRQEAMEEMADNAETRPVLEHYSVAYLDQMVAMVTAAATTPSVR